MAGTEQRELLSVHQAHPSVPFWKRIFHNRSKETPTLADTVNADLSTMQRGLTHDSYGNPIAPVLAEQLDQALPAIRKIVGPGDLTVIPTSRIESTDSTGRRLNGFSIRKAWSADTALSGTNPRVLVHLTSTWQIDSIDGIVFDEPKQTISGPAGRDPDADLHLLRKLIDAALASKKIGS